MNRNALVLGASAMVGLFFAFKRSTVPRPRPVPGTGGGATPVILGEGALWDDEKKVLYHIDIVGGKIFVYCPKAKKNIRTIDLRQYVGAVVRRSRTDVWHLIAACHRGFAVVDVDSGQVVEWLADPEAEVRGNRMNDGKCDPQGRFWCGSMDLFCAGQVGALYCLDTDMTVTKKVDNAIIPNGIVWSQDGNTMYWADTGKNSVFAFDFDQLTGAVSNRRAVICLPSDPKAPGFMGYIDGTTLDAEGRLWAAMWDGWGVRRFDLESGKCLGYIRVPVAQTTSVAFGGKDLSTMYITTASCGIGKEGWAAQPEAGHLFQLDMSASEFPGVRGVASVAFRG